MAHKDADVTTVTRNPLPAHNNVHLLKPTDEQLAFEAAVAVLGESLIVWSAAQTLLAQPDSLDSNPLDYYVAKTYPIEISSQGLLLKLSNKSQTHAT